jgi:hypothetical protein
MTPYFPALAIAGALFGACFTADVTFAQKSGGVLKVYFFDSPASMSIHEEATIAVKGPMMGVFNNFVTQGQTRRKKRVSAIVPIRDRLVMTKQDTVYFGFARSEVA